jgi:hypothetical protein
MRTSWIAATATLCCAAFGCSANVSAEAPPPSEGASSTAAIVVVQRTIDESASAETVARFLRVPGGAASDDALRLVGAPVDFPAAGACVSVGNDSPTSGVDPAISVELLDVGTVAVAANGLETTLLARQVPDVVDLVSGVVYARAADVDQLPAVAPYELRVTGSAATGGPFVIAADAPADLVALAVSRQDTRAVTLAAGASVDLEWSPGSADDLVYVDMDASERMPTLRCAFADASGRGSIAAALVPDSGTLSVHRLRRTHFSAQGVDSGEMRFDFARVVAFSHR